MRSDVYMETWDIEVDGDTLHVTTQGERIATLTDATERSDRLVDDDVWAVRSYLMAAAPDLFRTLDNLVGELSINEHYCLCGRSTDDAIRCVYCQARDALRQALHPLDRPMKEEANG